MYGRHNAVQHTTGQVHQKVSCTAKFQSSYGFPRMGLQRPQKKTAASHRLQRFSTSRSRCWAPVVRWAHYLLKLGYSQLRKGIRHGPSPSDLLCPLLRVPTCRGVLQAMCMLCGVQSRCARLRLVQPAGALQLLAPAAKLFGLHGLCDAWHRVQLCLSWNGTGLIGEETPTNTMF